MRCPGQSFSSSSSPASQSKLLSNRRTFAGLSRSGSGFSLLLTSTIAPKWPSFCSSVRGFNFLRSHTYCPRKSGLSALLGPPCAGFQETDRARACRGRQVHVAKQRSVVVRFAFPASSWIGPRIAYKKNDKREHVVALVFAGWSRVGD